MKQKPMRPRDPPPERSVIDPKRASKGPDPMLGKHGRPQAPRDENHAKVSGKKPKAK